MRGKKSDQAFVAQFIAEAVQHGIETPEEIIKDAKKKIEQIDEEIKAVEAKKILRSKLLDVILTFEKQIKTTSDNAKFLPFFDLEYPAQCKEICDLLKSGVSMIPINSWRTQYMEDGATIKFCYKQLLERKILSRKGDNLIRGERFDEYMTFVLREVK